MNESGPREPGSTSGFPCGHERTDDPTDNSERLAKPDIQRELIPRNDTVHLIGALNAMKDKVFDAAQQWELLDESGHVPAAPSYTTLLQHAADAQALSRDIIRLTADFARSPHSATRAGSAVLAHLATAATMSSHAAPHFAETAESALSLTRPSKPTDPRYPQEPHGHRPRLGASLPAAHVGISPRRG